MHCEVRKGSPEKRIYQISLEGCYVGPLYFRDLSEFGLLPADRKKAGADTDSWDLEIEAYQAEDIRDRILGRAYRKAVSLLASTELAASDIRIKLKMRDFSREITEEVISRLYEEHALDDGRYVESYVRVYASTRSRERLLRELEMKGISLPDLPERVDAVYREEGISDAENMRKLLRKRFPDVDLTLRKNQSRAIGFLARKGYAIPDILSVLPERSD